MENPFSDIIVQLIDIKSALAKLQSDYSKLPTPQQEEILNVDEASKFLGLTKDTIYGLVHERKIPHMKPDKKLYFSKQELINWLKASRRKTIYEIAMEADTKIASKQRGYKAA